MQEYRGNKQQTGLVTNSLDDLTHSIMEEFLVFVNDTLPVWDI